MASQVYPSDLSDQAWKIVAALFPVNRGPGRPLELDPRQIVDAILYVVRTGCQW